MNFWQIVMLMFWFFLFLLWIFVLISVFVDIFRRDDLSGWAKAGWALLVFIVPVLGVLIYVIFRPKLTADEREDVAAYERVVRPDADSAAEEIAKLAKLRSDGEISEEEYERLKQRVM